MSIDNIVKQHGAFWAFSNEQFNEQKQEGVKYYRLQAGLICPQDTVEQFMADVKLFQSRKVKADKKKNTTEEIVLRELANREAQVLGSIESTVDALNGYGISSDEIQDIFDNIYMPYCQKHDLF